ncbi:MAG: hypothetical protein LBU41_04990 [Clostridiales Family XIII bacterium]|jgi:hypothetical protein|nr:hypothetical protein [Clostridiales Family XIII bacterium]
MEFLMAADGQISQPAMFSFIMNLSAILMIFKELFNGAYIFGFYDECINRMQGGRKIAAIEEKKNEHHN